MTSRKAVVCLIFGLVITSLLTIGAGKGWAQDFGSDHYRHSVNNPIQIVGVIPIPGSPLVSSDLIFADPITQRVYMSDRSNNGVDIIDAVYDTYVGRVGGMAGPLTTGGGTATTNDQGPNGLLVTPNLKLWAGDGNATVQVADVDPNSPTYLQILHSISDVNPECDNGTNHYCGRADELGYDPLDHIILIMNDRPLALAAPHAASTPYGTFISTDTYKVLGQVLLPGAGGAEQPVWDPELGRFLVEVPGSATQDSMVAVIDPLTMSVPTAYFPVKGCTAGNGLALGPFQTLLATLCSTPVVINALNGNVINTITQVAGGDEVWYNPGDGRFYGVGNDLRNNLTKAMGVIDAQTGTWLQNVDGPGMKEATAYEGNNHIYSEDVVTAAQVSAPATDNTVCATYGYKGVGCVVVFAHQ